jgi:hypothetical protein
MAFADGTLLGLYEIVAPLGVGEVHRAVTERNRA